MHEQGIEDFQQAKRKVLQQPGLGDAALPSNEEIAAALREQLRLLAPDTCQSEALLQQALELMRLFEPFGPRLSGRLAAGLVTEHSWLHLHLFCETAEEVDIYLQERGITYRPEDKRMRFHDGQRNQPAFVFEYQGSKVLAVVFTPKQRSQAPLSPIDGKPMPRLKARQVAALLTPQGES
ncbi:MAG: hypothetical protein ACPHER_01095 [Nevskiales bacterium]